MTQPPRDANSQAPPPRGPLIVGGLVLVVGLLTPLAIPLVTKSDLSTGWKTSLSGLLLVGVPEIFTLVAVAIMGKRSFNWLKQQLFALLRRSAPPERVSRTRYRVGLVLLCLPVLLGWALPYIRPLVPAIERHELALAIGGDLTFLVSLFVLGGEFWNKLKGLFLFDATIRYSESTAPRAGETR